MIFDNSRNYLHSPKQFERIRRDDSVTVNSNHQCSDSFEVEGKCHKLPKLQEKTGTIFDTVFSGDLTNKNEILTNTPDC